MRAEGSSQTVKRKQNSLLQRVKQRLLVVLLSKLCYDEALKQECYVRPRRHPIFSKSSSLSVKQNPWCLYLFQVQMQHTFIQASAISIATLPTRDHQPKRPRDEVRCRTVVYFCHCNGTRVLEHHQHLAIRSGRAEKRSFSGNQR